MTTARLKRCGDVYLAERGAIFDGNLRCPATLSCRRTATSGATWS